MTCKTDRRFWHVPTQMIFEKTIINTYRFVEIEALKNGHTMLIDLTCLETMQMYKPNDEQKIKTQRKNFVLKRLWNTCARQGAKMIVILNVSRQRRNI